jgi:uncharacterized spore protein YtfJ
MDVQELLAQARDAITVKRVFGDPVERDGTTIVPVAAVRGGAGAGGAPGDQNSGSGSGYGLSARPVGVFVIRDGQVSWQPAFDLNRAILGGQLAGIALFLSVRAMTKSRARTKRTKLRSQRLPFALRS